MNTSLEIVLESNLEELSRGVFRSLELCFYISMWYVQLPKQKVADVLLECFRYYSETGNVTCC